VAAPVEDRADVPVRAVGEVAGPVVAVRDPGVRRWQRGRAGDEPTVRGVDDRQVRERRGVHLTVPAAQLTLQVGAVAAQVAQTDRVRLDGVQGGEDVDGVEARDRARPPSARR
jgi:hypothetical protein